jgi:hypothetical protein
MNAYESLAKELTGKRVHAIVTRMGSVCPSRTAFAFSTYIFTERGTLVFEGTTGTIWPTNAALARCKDLYNAGYCHGKPTIQKVLSSKNNIQIF